MDTGMKRSAPSYMLEPEKSVMIVYLPQEVDDFNCACVIGDTEHILSEHKGVKKIIFDFTETEFMDSTGIGILLSRYRRMKGIGGEICLYGVNERVERLLNISGVLKIAKIIHVSC